jgi:AAA family ATP:ADP antiporter
LTGIIGLSVLVANLVEYQFSDVASRVIEDKDRLTAFFGFWASTLSIVSLMIQLFLTGRVLKFLGVAASLFFLPLGLLIGAGAILINPALWTAVLIKVSDGSLKHSINKAGTELLFMPIAAEVKNRAKAFIDVFIRNSAKGFGGILLIVLTMGLGFSIQHISLILAALIAAWIYLIIKVRDEYVNSFRLAIEKRTIDLDQESLNPQDASVFNSFQKALDSGGERQILYVLDLLEEVENDELIPYLGRLVSHPSHEVKGRVLNLALQYEKLDLTTDAEALVNCDDQTVRTEAICYLYKKAVNKISKLREYLDHEDYRIRVAALMCASVEWREDKEFRSEIDLKGLLEEMLKSIRLKAYDIEQKSFIKIYVARMIGKAKNPDLYPYLHVLLYDESPEVAQEAVISVGKTKAKEFIPILITHLKTKYVRKYARESLAEYGEEIVDTLAEYLEETREDRKIRLGIPKVLALIDSQKSTNVLMDNLDQKDLLLRHEVIKALNKLRVNFPMLKIEKQHIDTRVMGETKQYYRFLTLLHRQKNTLSTDQAQGSTGSDSDGIIRARRLLMTAIEEKLDRNLERIFRLLGLKYAAEDMYYAYLGVKSNKAVLRATAVEFLDNILETNLKKTLIPIIETTTDEVLLAKTQELFGYEIPSESEGMEFILRGDDNWLKTCTLYLTAEESNDTFMDIAAELVDDPDLVVKETAKFYLKKIGISN